MILLQFKAKCSCGESDCGFPHEEVLLQVQFINGKKEGDLKAAKETADLCTPHLDHPIIVSHGDLARVTALAMTINSLFSEMGEKREEVELPKDVPNDLSLWSKYIDTDPVD